MINTQVNKNNIFSRGNSVIPRGFLGIAVYIAAVYINGTEDHSPWLEALFVKFLELQVGLKCVTQPGIRSFYKSCSKISGANFWTPILIQRYGNMSGYDTDILSGLHKHFSGCKRSELHQLN